MNIYSQKVTMIEASITVESDSVNWGFFYNEDRPFEINDIVQITFKSSNSLNENYTQQIYGPAENGLFVKNVFNENIFYFPILIHLMLKLGYKICDFLELNSIY